MKLPRRNFLHLVAGAAALPAVSRSATAQTYPSRPVRIVVTFPAGSTSDTLARPVGQWLSERLGQPFIIDNRPGAGGTIGTEAVVRSPADGYTLLLVSGAHTVNETLYDKLNFNFIRDIAPIAGISRENYVMVINPSFPGQDRCRVCRVWPMPIQARSTWPRPASAPQARPASAPQATSRASCLR
jgi:tripartite-type tricarboxylate transporter receptor subunit TctC